MQTTPIKFERNEARELWRKYREHKHYSAPLDEEIARIYQRIAQGRTVIRALASIVAAGMHTGGPYHNLPKLAICRASADRVFWRPDMLGGRFNTQAWQRSNAAQRNFVSIPRGMWPGIDGRWPNGEAKVPQIPLHLRPKRGLANYHILWEAEWKSIPPCDPLLLRRIGEGDAWLLVAAWDLTDVEKAVLATRMNA